MTQKYKLNQLTIRQFESVRSLMFLLHTLRAVSAYYIIHKAYYDTITTYRSSVPTFNADISWQEVYDIEDIVLIEK